MQRILTLLTALLLAPLAALHADDKQLGKIRPGKNDDHRKTSVFKTGRLRFDYVPKNARLDKEEARYENDAKPG